MKINISTDDATIRPDSYRSFTLDFECNPSDIVNQLEAEDIAKNYYQLDDLINEIGIDSFAYHFGSKILSHFTIDEVLEQFPIEEIINHIGQDKFKNYIREIFIDRIIE